jgi:hypothetical protein
MDVERTMEFILQQQAEFASNMAKLQKNVGGLQKLAKMGASELLKLARAQQRTDTVIRELAERQKSTEAELRAFIRSLRGGTNGGGLNGRKRKS